MNFLDVRYRYDNPSLHGFPDEVRQGRVDASHQRTHLLANAIKIGPALFPQLWPGLKNLGESMRLDSGVDCFVVADPAMQAYCMPRVSDAGEDFTVVVTSGLVERLKVEEIRFVIGHEVGHFLCGHWRYPTGEDQANLGGRLAALQLMRAAEISADRIGMLACGSLEHSCAAMIKAAAGLGEPFLQPDIPSLLLQFRELAAGSGMASAIWATHPVIPLRIRALLRFEPLHRAILKGGEMIGAELEKIDQAVDADFHRSSGNALRQVAVKPLEMAKVWGLVAILSADGVLSEEDQRQMVLMLGNDAAGKAIRFIKGHDEGALRVVVRKLEEACNHARIASLGDREALLRQFRDLLDQSDGWQPETEEMFDRIGMLMGVDSGTG